MEQLVQMPRSLRGLWLCDPTRRWFNAVRHKASSAQAPTQQQLLRFEGIRGHTLQHNKNKQQQNIFSLEQLVQMPRSLRALWLCDPTRRWFNAVRHKASSAQAPTQQQLLRFEGIRFSQLNTLSS